MAGGRDNLVACAKLLKSGAGTKQVNRLLVGLEKGFAGRSSGEIPGGTAPGGRQEPGRPGHGFERHAGIAPRP